MSKDNDTPLDWFQDFIEVDPDIPTKCISCGFTEIVPSFIYDEFSTKKFHIKFRKSISTLHCQKCQKETAVSLYWFDKIEK